MIAKGKRELALSTARKRRYRQRQKAGIQVVRVEVDQEIVENLLAKRLLNVNDCGDPRQLSSALQKLARDASR